MAHRPLQKGERAIIGQMGNWRALYRAGQEDEDWEACVGRGVSVVCIWPREYVG